MKKNIPIIRRGARLIRVPVAPPGKAMPTAKDYDRKRQKSDVRQDIEIQERELEEK